MTLSFVGVVLASLMVVALARDPAPAFCKDPADLPFCSVLPGQGNPLPAPIPDTDTVQVWVLQAPVWEFDPTLGNITSRLKLIHTAIGLVNEVTGAEYSFEFEGIYESPNSTFPFVVANTSVPGGQDVVWCNAGAVCWDSTIDWSYYITFKQQVATINGTVFNKLIQWIPVDNDTFSVTYETFAVWNSWDNGKGKMYMSSYTCDDYAWRILGILAGWGAQFANVPISRVFLNFYVTKPPIPVDVSDPQVYAQVVNSYATYDIWGKAALCSKIVNETVKKDECEAEVGVALFEWLETSKYLYYDGQYYYLEQSGYSFDWKYVVWPVVPVTLSPEEIERKLPNGFATAATVRA